VITLKSTTLGGGFVSWIREFAVCLIAAFAALASVPAAAQSAHNFVVRQPPPSYPDPFYQPEFIDTASVKRAGDLITFDVLRTAWLWTLPPATPGASRVASAPYLIGNIVHVRFSCAWWTLAETGESGSYDANGDAQLGFDPAAVPAGIMRTSGPFESQFDRLCGGGKLDEANGFNSIKTAMDWARRSMPSTPPPLGIPPMPRPPVKVAWMDGEHPHRFLPLAIQNTDGAVLYLDVANLKREGAGAEGLSLLVLGAKDQRGNTANNGVVALRRVVYDCDHLSMSVGGQAIWNRYGIFMGASAVDFDRRGASTSRAAAAEISAACAGGKAGPATTYASVDDAWAHAHALWPPAPPSETLRTAACLWEHAPAGIRSTMTAAVLAHRRANPIPYLTALAPVLPACGVSAANKWLAFGEVSRYAERKVALEQLQASRGLTETKLNKIWAEMTWLDRLRIERMGTAEDRAAAETALAALAASSGITSQQDAAVFATFMSSEAFFDDD
jgi:hypothetical protein